MGDGVAAPKSPANQPAEAVGEGTARSGSGIPLA